MRKILSSKIHRATVTDANLDYVGSISIDKTIIEQSGLVQYEEVHVVDITNGARLHTYVMEAPRNSGTIQLNGAAAHLINPKDLIIIMGYHYIQENNIVKHLPNIVFLDQYNAIIDEQTQYAIVHGE